MAPVDAITMVDVRIDDDIVEIWRISRSWLTSSTACPLLAFVNCRRALTRKCNVGSMDTNFGARSLTPRWVSAALRSREAGEDPG